MNTYAKTLGITLLALGASAAVTARPAEPIKSAEPDIVVLPSQLVTNMLQYLQARPYQEVFMIMQNMQRCLQDQVPDGNGVVAERGKCPEISVSLRQLKIPLAQTPPKVQKAP